ncbi:NAD(P)-binding protein [Xylona heveae TC161]|uniref:NAD(P)-binding protein n=1 Tax=Xylona heveae (strain CBS 132557 / TC161) TaxID=1328760 RepID=A0A164ZRD6_XYLHT|nr:NAD(P)-binding protein [Xylona heveae TC161]KZF19414.1 NAD(P)-binding protein [Xylona heveae TC161]
MLSKFTVQATIPSLLRTHISQPTRYTCLPAFKKSFSPSASSASISSSASACSGRLSGKKCLITGASRGIGRAIAARFAAEDASCVLVGRNVSTIEKVAAELEGKARHQTRAGDVGDRAFWVETAKELKDIDILVNAAGITHSSLLLATKPELVENIYRTNLLGTTWACQVFAKNMVRRKAGCIINVSSLLGVAGGRGSAAYAASKAGILGLTRALAGEMGQSNIRVNAIVPGYIETQMTDENARAQALEAVPAKRFGKPEEIADAAIFLALNEYANNCIINLDGGLSAM